MDFTENLKDPPPLPLPFPSPVPCPAPVPRSWVKKYCLESYLRRVRYQQNALSSFSPARAIQRKHPHAHTPPSRAMVAQLTRIERLERDMKDVDKSPYNVFKTGKAARKNYDKVWNAAAHAPIFCKITKKTITDANGKKREKDCFRTSRLIGSHAYKVAASGAGLYASKVLQCEGEVLRTETFGEKTRAPWLPTLSAGARMVLEQFLSALAQEAGFKGHAIREGVGNSKRLSKTHVKSGWEATYDSVFGSSTLLPMNVITLALEKKKASKGKVGTKEVEAKGDDEYNPPVEDDAGEDVADK